LKRRLFSRFSFSADFLVLWGFFLLTLRASKNSTRDWDLRLLSEALSLNFLPESANFSPPYVRWSGGVRPYFGTAFLFYLSFFLLAPSDTQCNDFFVSDEVFFSTYRSSRSTWSRKNVLLALRRSSPSGPPPFFGLSSFPPLPPNPPDQDDWFVTGCFPVNLPLSRLSLARFLMSSGASVLWISPLTCPISSSVCGHSTPSASAIGCSGFSICFFELLTPAS